MSHPLISRDPKIMFGKACFAGTRIPVSLILDKLAAGESVGDIKLGFPELTDDHFQAALRYASESIDHLVVFE
jgi:uncharacterized protein (DUF433 family)